MPPKTKSTKAATARGGGGNKKVAAATKKDVSKKPVDITKLKKEVNNLNAKKSMIEDHIREKKNRLKEIDGIQLDLEVEAEKNEWNLECKKFEDELDDEDEEAKKARIERRHGRAKVVHTTKLCELMQKMSLDRETLDQEAATLSKEAENLRLLNKKVTKELNEAKKALKKAQD